MCEALSGICSWHSVQPPVRGSLSPSPTTSTQVADHSARSAFTYRSPVPVPVPACPPCWPWRGSPVNTPLGLPGAPRPLQGLAILHPCREHRENRTSTASPTPRSAPPLLASYRVRPLCVAPQVLAERMERSTRYRTNPRPHPTRGGARPPPEAHRRPSRAAEPACLACSSARTPGVPRARAAPTPTALDSYSPRHPQPPTNRPQPDPHPRGRGPRTSAARCCGRPSSRTSDLGSRQVARPQRGADRSSTPFAHHWHRGLP